MSCGRCFGRRFARRDMSRAAEATTSSVERKAISVISEPDSGMYEAKEYGIEITNGSVEQLKGRFDAVVLGLAHAFSTI